jgi:lipoate-protein ligase B
MGPLMTRPRPVWCLDPGRLDFPRAHALQLDVVEARATGKLDRDVVLVLEHSPVFTIGRRGNRGHLKVPSRFLKKAGMALVHTERGGDITFHGPGQLVLYPIFQLPRAGLGVVDYVEKLEEVMLRTAAGLGVTAARDRRNHGVWVGDRKMGFVGIAVRRRVSFHGISLNVDLPLEPFTWINPCGLENVGVTTLNLETRQKVSFDIAKAALLQNFECVFSVSLQLIKTSKLKDKFQSKQV